MAPEGSAPANDPPVGATPDRVKEITVGNNKRKNPLGWTCLGSDKGGSILNLERSASYCNSMKVIYET